MRPGNPVQEGACPRLLLAPPAALLRSPGSAGLRRGQPGFPQEADQIRLVELAEGGQLAHIDAALARLALRDERGVGAQPDSDLLLSETQPLPSLAQGTGQAL